MFIDNVDLERFPTSESAKEMLSYVTKGWYDKSYVGKWIYQVLGAEMDLVRGYVEGLKNQAFPEICSWGMYLHELMYGIPVDSTKDIDERRKAVLYRKDRSHRMSVTPYRIESLIQQAFGLTASVTEQTDKYTFTLDILVDADFVIGATDEIIAYVRKIKPSHLSFTTGYVIEAAVGIEQERFILPDIEIDMSAKWSDKSELPLVDIKLEVQESTGVWEGNVMLYQNLVQWNGEYAWDGTVRFNTEVTQEDL